MTTKQLDKAIRAAGWSLRRQSRHRVYACPCGSHLLTTPSTASDHRSAKNALATLARLSRQCAA